MQRLDWPSNALQVHAIRDVLRSRVDRALQVARALAAHSRRPSVDWERRVSAALADLGGTLSADRARRVVSEWDHGRPEDIPPVSIALASWFGSRERWSSDALQRAIDQLDRDGDYGLVGLIASLRESSGSGRAEAIADATAIARWALRRPRGRPPTPPTPAAAAPPPPPAPSPGAGIAFVIAALAALLVLGGRRGGR